MDVSADAPYLDMAYKLVEYQGRHVLKTSAGKATWTGRKQVYRFLGRDGRFVGDRIALRDESPSRGEVEFLLRTVMEGGPPPAPPPPTPPRTAPAWSCSRALWKGRWRRPKWRRCAGGPAAPLPRPPRNV